MPRLPRRIVKSLGLVALLAWAVFPALPALQADAASGHADATILTGAFPAAGSTVSPYASVGALYQADSPLNTIAAFQPVFTLDGVQVPYTTAPGPKGSKRYSTILQYELPLTTADGSHAIHLKTWDSSQKANGGNWAELSWAVTMFNPASAPSSASSPSSPVPSSTGTVQSQGVKGPVTQPSNPAGPADPTVMQSAKTKPGTGTGCSEDSFLGSAFPASGSTVKPGDLVGANYQDESPLNNAPGFQVIFTLDGAQVPFSTLPGPKGKEKYSTLIQYQLPASIAGGVHTVVLKAWDSDQNKTGGDCGTATWTFTVVTPERGIMVVKSGSTLAHEGDSVTYSFAVTNTGKADLFNVTVDDDVLGHIGTIASLPLGTTQTLTKVFVVPVGKNDIVNTVTACGRDASGTQVCDDDHHKLHPIHPAIALVKTADPVSVNPGGSVTYTYKVTNTGDVDLTNVTVEDDVLGHIGTLPSLATGASQTLRKTVTITLTSKTHNVATADGTDPLGRHVSAQDDATITVVLGEQITQPLPRTGAFLALEAMAGLALLAGGGAVLMLRRGGARAE